ncbi:MAG: mechanosensitive ion channel family protein [Candidatus Micrarchaeota archaeon]
MVDVFSLAVIALEVLLIGFVGFWVGKGVHFVVLRLSKKMTLSTKTKLDDYVVEYLGNPLKLVFVVLSVFAVSHFVENLAGISTALQKYSFAILVIVASYVIAELVGAILRWYYFKVQQEGGTLSDVALIPVVRKVSRVLIVAFGILAAMSMVGLDVTGLLALTSIVALLLGLASQETLANFFAGIALQLDQPYQYDNYLRFSSGEVARLKKIGLRSARLEDLDGNEMAISNSEFAKQRIVNLSKPEPGFKHHMVVDVPLRVDVAELEKFVLKSLESIPEGGVGKKGFFSVKKVLHDHYSVSLEFWVSNYSALNPSVSYLNRKILEFVQKKR